MLDSSGLHHTFEGGCKDAGDAVADTPAAKGETETCVKQDSCPNAPGNDPIHNFMGYTSDDCVSRFSAGQAWRMRAQLNEYKPRGVALWTAAAAHRLDNTSTWLAGNSSWAATAFTTPSAGAGNTTTLRCVFALGDGAGDREEYVTLSDTMQACEDHVHAARPAANGVTWGLNDRSCYAEYGLAGQRTGAADGLYVSCMFPAPATTTTTAPATTTATDPKENLDCRACTSTRTRGFRHLPNP